MSKDATTLVEIKCFLADELSSDGLSGFVDGAVGEADSLDIVILLIWDDSPVVDTQVSGVVNTSVERGVIVEVASESIFMVTFA